VTLAFVNVIASVLCEAISPMKRGIASTEKLPRNDTITYLFTTTQAITIDDDSFVEGSLRLISYARPGKLFTANSSIIKSQVGTLGDESFKVIIDAVIKVLRSDVSQESELYR